MALSFRTGALSTALSSGTALATGVTVAVGDFAIVTVSQNGTLASQITSISSFSDSAGNTWTQTIPLTLCSHTTTSASMATYTSVITNASSNLTITTSFSVSGSSRTLQADVITGFVGTATLDPGGYNLINNATTPGNSLSQPILNSGTGVVAAEACYAVVAAGGTIGSFSSFTETGITTTSYSQLEANSANASSGAITTAAPTSSSSLNFSWSTNRVSISAGFTVYDSAPSGYNTPSIIRQAVTRAATW